MYEYEHTFEVGDSTETITREGGVAHAHHDEAEIAEQFGVDEEDVTWVLTEEIEPPEGRASGAVPCIECSRPIWKARERAREDHENEYPKSTCGRCAEKQDKEQADTDASEV